MVKSASGKVDMRSFTVIDVRKVNGSPTKFPKDTRFVNKNPAQAARKMGNKLCNMKRVKGTCAFLIRIQETTQGGDNKIFDYTFKRVKLDEPVVVGDRKYFYTSKVFTKKDSKKFDKSSNSVSTSGRMMKYSRRTNTINNNQPKYKQDKKLSKKTDKTKQVTKSKQVTKTNKTKKSLFSKLFS